jgi:hypothetical protein
MSLPPAARPPGRKLSPESKREVEKVRRVQGAICAGALEKQRKGPQKPRSVSHIKDFRDGSKVNRRPNGRFAPETGVPHKRPPKQPPFVGPWTEERKQKARLTRVRNKRLREP